MFILFYIYLISLYYFYLISILSTNWSPSIYNYIKSGLQLTDKLKIGGKQYNLQQKKDKI
jgi:hypothetical protein